jgi:hypothetical protein
MAANAPPWAQPQPQPQPHAPGFRAPPHFGAPVAPGAHMAGPAGFAATPMRPMQPMQPAAPQPSGGFGVGGVALEALPMQQIGGLFSAYGQQLWQQKQQQYGSWFSFLAPQRLKYYFAVNNSYVLNKLRLILFPFGRKFRRESDIDPSSGAVEFKPPRDDVNAPDLYIPTMAFITYVLLVGLVLGVKQRFSPEHLGMAASSALAVLFLEAMLAKFGFYLSGVDSRLALLDLLAFSSYKFVGLLLAILAGLLLGSLVFWLAVVFVALAFMVFMVRTVDASVAAAVVGHPAAPENKSARNSVLLLIGLMQIGACYLLVRNAAPV